MVRLFPKRAQSGSTALSETNPETDEGATLSATAGKGRPTRSRKEAEAAAKLRAKQARVVNGSKRQQRAYQVSRSREIRAAVKDGDERYLSARDRGPVRRFTRDFVDRRLSMGEIALPMLLVGLLLSGVYPVLSAAMLNSTLLLVTLDMILLRFSLRRAITRRFGKDALKGTTLYAFSRAFQLRFMRIPRRQVALGQPLPEHYR